MFLILKLLIFKFLESTGGNAIFVPELILPLKKIFITIYQIVNMNNLITIIVRKENKEIFLLILVK
ncbi:MAG: hypothetical protein A2149_07360 [Candidatus Schekmanbacteria bacterium RBG_16_38_11]|uniref:Uncharacterized protein n=2 Tax=Candidatus Schekmaniibacteriota TaxID=1817811 RepID=A0A1F7RF74_9BACT|nr:MAG: hypothetical protein A2042_09985 [Candidatus Schekmanbacteria bacterium GWA2_38_11]OGL44217.1 MAG: hypothetical protein A2149_07360 [Candidatus Schekmanbacteria bacterium RBG_16_38_11]